MPNAAVAVRGGRIVAAGTRSAVGRRRGERTVNLGDMLLMPGLINAHTHLEEGVLRGYSRGDGETFSSWMAKKDSRLRNASAEALLPTVRLGIREALAHGTTTIVDSSRTGTSLPVLKDEPIRAWVIQELHDEGDVADGTFLHTLDLRRRLVEGSEQMRVGVGPHALFSLGPKAHKDVARMALNRGIPWACHVAESAEELQAFSEQRGDLFFHITRKRPWPFGEARMGSLHYAISRTIIPRGAILFHCNYAGGAELSLLAAKRASIVISPRYDAGSGNKSHPVDLARKRGLNLCVGTESIAEVESMSLFDDLFALKSRYPHIPAAELLTWATANAARALGVGGSLGELVPDAFADMIGVSFAHGPKEDLLEELLVEEPSVRFVMTGGEEVIVDY